jgi:hypothetical protein
VNNSIEEPEYLVRVTKFNVVLFTSNEAAKECSSKRAEQFQSLTGPTVPTVHCPRKFDLRSNFYH